MPIYGRMLKMKKNKFEREKTITSLASNLEITSKIFSLSFQIGLSTGALLLIIYCSRIGFYPVGVNVGDSLFLIAIALCFGFSYTLLVMLLGSVGAVLSSVFKKIITKLSNSGEKNSTPITLFEITADNSPLWFIGSAVLLFIVINAFNDLSTSLTLVATASIMALALSSLASKANPKWSALKVGMAFIFYFSPLLIGGIFGNLLDYTFKLAGIRLNSVSLYLETSFYKDIIKGQGGPISGSESKYWKIDDVTVLFTGAGTSSLVRISECGSESRVFVMPNDKFHIEIKNNSNK